MDGEKREKLFTEEILKALLQLFIFAAIYIIFYKYEGAKIINLCFIKNEYLKEKVKDSFLVVVTCVMYFCALQAVINIGKFVTKPIKLNISIINAIDGDNCTKVYHFEETRSDMQYEVKITLEVIKTNSLWNKVAIKALKNKEVEIFICVEPRNGGICCQPECITEEFKLYNKDFGIIISDFLLSNLKQKVPFKKECSFLLAEDRDKPISGNTDFPIKPIVYINGKELSFMYKKIIGLSSNLRDGYYPVKFTIYDKRR